MTAASALSMSHTPAALTDWLSLHPRQKAVVQQGFMLRVDWWNSRIASLGLPGGPVRGANGTTGRDFISREYLFSLADDAVEDATGVGALRLLWHTLLWGTGDTNRGNAKRINSVALDPERIGQLLRDAAQMARNDAGRAFRLLKPRGTAIKGLGPGFFTKFLYFAGGGTPTHPCLIVDSRVQSTLHRATGSSHALLRASFVYDVDAYLAALAVLKRWAKETSTPTRVIAPDEVERWAFTAGRDGSAHVKK